MRQRRPVPSRTAPWHPSASCTEVPTLHQPIISNALLLHTSSLKRRTGNHWACDTEPHIWTTCNDNIGECLWFVSLSADHNQILNASFPPQKRNKMSNATNRILLALFIKKNLDWHLQPGRRALTGATLGGSAMALSTIPSSSRGLPAVWGYSPASAATEQKTRSMIATTLSVSLRRRQVGGR